jgi:hypothetical protein
MGFTCIEDGAMKKIAANLLAIMLSSVLTCARRGNFTPYTLDRKTEQIGNPRIPRRLPESPWPRPRHFCDRVVRADTGRTAERYAIVRHFVAATSSLMVLDPGEAEKDRNEV